MSEREGENLRLSLKLKKPVTNRFGNEVYIICRLCLIIPTCCPYDVTQVICKRIERDREAE